MISHCFSIFFKSEPETPPKQMLGRLCKVSFTAAYLGRAVGGSERTWEQAPFDFLVMYVNALESAVQ